MFDFLLAIVAFIVVLTPLIFVHEYGHFWAARRAGIRVEVFSIGFGNELVAFTDKRNTRWRVAAIPLGGYVKMAGDQDFTGRPKDDAFQPQPGEFLAASLLSRIFVVSMGPLANFLLGIVLFAALFMTAGKIITSTEVSQVVADSPAEAAGIIAGDRITAINGYQVEAFSDMRILVAENPGRPIAITLLRSGRELTLEATPNVAIHPQSCIQYGQLGIFSEVQERVTYGPFSALVAGTEETADIIMLIFRGLGRLLTGNASASEFGGPIRIAEFSATAVRGGIESAVVWTALLSINLGLLNLLPIPVLDGGHLLFYAIEGVTGRRLAPRVQDWVMRLGLAFLLTLFILVTFFDIRGWITTPC